MTQEYRHSKELISFSAIDLFSGCGGLSKGLEKAGFSVVAAIELDRDAAKAFKLNHKKTVLFEEDIRKFDPKKIKKLLKGKDLHLLAGCPPCQGFSSIRRLNRKDAYEDEKNDLILEYLRFVKDLKPLTIMLENVPGLLQYDLFKFVRDELQNLGYSIKTKILNVSDYGVPQRRKRLIMVGSRLGEIEIAEKSNALKTVRDAIGNIEPVNKTKDVLHKIYPKHIPRIEKMISLIPKNGGRRKELPEKYILDCHKKKNVGFNDVYGRECVSLTV